MAFLAPAAVKAYRTAPAASVYEADAGPQRVHFPPLQGHRRCDVCIVGGGYTGLHTALRLAKRGFRVIVLEAARVGFGSSGRNGGQISAGYACDMAAFRRSLGAAAAQDIWSLAAEATVGLRDLIATHGIPCDYTPGHMEVAVLARRVGALRDWQETAARDYGYTSHEFIDRAELRRYVGSARYQAGLYDARGGHVHPLKLALGLARACADAGVEICEQSGVTGWREGARVHARTAHGEVEVDYLVLAAGTGIDDLDPALSRKILPVGTYIIATEPLPGAVADRLIPSRAAVSDTQFILDYFRLSADNRLLFGGGVSYTGAPRTDITAHLRHRMVRVFPELREARIAYTWGGYIDVSRSRMPMIGRCGKAVLYAMGYAGAGLVPTYVAGQIISDAIAGTAERLDLFSALRHRDFPGGRHLRGPLTALAMTYFRLRDYV